MHGQRIARALDLGGLRAVLDVGRDVIPLAEHAMICRQRGGQARLGTIQRLLRSGGGIGIGLQGDGIRLVDLRIRVAKRHPFAACFIHLQSSFQVVERRPVVALAPINRCKRAR